MSSRSNMSVAADDGGMASQPRPPGDIGRVAQAWTREAHLNPLPRAEAYQTPEFPSPAVPAAGEIVKNKEQQTTGLPETSPATTARRQKPVGASLSNGDPDGAAREEEQRMAEVRGALLVVTSLLASVTYQAGLNPPGGLWQDESNERSTHPRRAGYPILEGPHEADTRRFHAFNFFNSFAFGYSVGTMVLLITGWSGSMMMRTMKYTMVLSLLFLGVAFCVGCSRDWENTFLFMTWPVVFVCTCIVLQYYFKLEPKKAARQPAEQVEGDVKPGTAQYHSNPDDHTP